MKQFSVLVSLFLLAICSALSAEQVTVNMEMRHLQRFNGISSGDNDYKVGGYSRGSTQWPYQQFSDEIILKGEMPAVLSSGAEVTGAIFRFNIYQDNAQERVVSINLFENTKGQFSITAEYDDFDFNPWENPVGLYTGQGTPGYKEISSLELTNLVKAWLDGSKTNEGFCLSGNFPDWGLNWEISAAELVVTL